MTICRRAPREHFARAQVGNFTGTRDGYLYPEDYGTRDIGRVGIAPAGGWVATAEQVRLRGTVDGRDAGRAGSAQGHQADAHDRRSRW